MLNTIDGPSESVEDYLCDPEEMPLGARESRLPCPEDCVLNDWGPWSRCSLVRAEPRSERSSSAVCGNIRFSVKPTEIYLDIFCLSEIFSLRLKEFKEEPHGFIVSECMNLCQQVIFHPPRKNQSYMNWDGGGK